MAGDFNVFHSGSMRLRQAAYFGRNTNGARRKAVFVGFKHRARRGLKGDGESGDDA